MASVHLISNWSIPMPHIAHRRFLALGLWVLAAPLVGCVSNPSVPAAVGADAGLPAGHGTVVLRASLQGLKFLNHFQVLLRPVGGGAPVSLQAWGASSTGYWSRYYDDDAKGGLLTVALPKGEYEVFGFNALSGAWGGLRSVQSGTPFGKRFRVDEGEVRYIGHVAVVVRGDRGVLPSAGGAMQLPTQVQVRDESAQDLKDIGQLLPGLSASRVRVGLAQ
jgi:hypothetical protein